MRWKESGPSGGPFRVCIMGQALADGPCAVKASGPLVTAPAHSPTRPPIQNMLWAVGWGSGPVPHPRERIKHEVSQP